MHALGSIGGWHEHSPPDVGVSLRLEYNRLLQEDPAQPRVSALPASILWSGSHQLWMFENVYCTRESFENEVEATDILGWVNGTVLRDLADEGILRTVDWQKLPVEVKDRLRRGPR